MMDIGFWLLLSNIFVVFYLIIIQTNLISLRIMVDFLDRILLFIFSFFINLCMHSIFIFSFVAFRSVSLNILCFYDLSNTLLVFGFTVRNTFSYFRFLCLFRCKRLFVLFIFHLLKLTVQNLIALFKLFNVMFCVF